MLRDKMLAVISELNGEIAERAELIHAIAMALLSGSNLFILGDPGQAKSFAINPGKDQYGDGQRTLPEGFSRDSSSHSSSRFR